MNAVGIDVSKGKSMVAIMRPCGVVAAEPFEVSHDGQALSELVERVKRLPVMRRWLWSTPALIMSQ